LLLLVSCDKRKDGEPGGALPALDQEALTLTAGELKERVTVIEGEWSPKGGTWSSKSGNQIYRESECAGIWVSSGDRDYGRNGNYSEYRKVHCLISQYIPTDADVLNGIEWKSSVAFTSSLSRSFSAKNVPALGFKPGWHEWESHVQQDETFLEFHLVKKSGKWEITYWREAGWAATPSEIPPG